MFPNGHEGPSKLSQPYSLDIAYEEKGIDGPKIELLEESFILHPPTLEIFTIVIYFSGTLTPTNNKLKERLNWFVFVSMEAGGDTIDSMVVFDMKPLKEIPKSIFYCFSESTRSTYGSPLLIKPLLKSDPENSCVEIVQKINSTLNCCVDYFKR
jgi:hypothetical protein